MTQIPTSYGDRPCVKCSSLCPFSAQFCIICGARQPMEGPTEKLADINQGYSTQQSSCIHIMGVSQDHRSYGSNTLRHVSYISGMEFYELIVYDVVAFDGTLIPSKVKFGIRKPQGDINDNSSED